MVVELLCMQIWGLALSKTGGSRVLPALHNWASITDLFNKLKGEPKVNQTHTVVKDLKIIPILGNHFVFGFKVTDIWN